MGSSESREQVTPSRPLRNQHLAHVTDPRSPTAGIPRTPIAVGDSPQRAVLSSIEEDLQDTPEITDPRSPTHGIVRTPLRPSLHVALNLLAKQLSDVFISEDSVVEESPSSALNPGPSVPEEPQTTPPADLEEAKKSSSEETPVVQPPVAPEPAQPAGQPQKPRGKSPRSTGAKHSRQRPRKALHSSAPGRSPFKILQEDNSPSTATAFRQVKKLSVQNDQSPSLRSAKIPHSSWETTHNKENALYRQTQS
ncbi:cell division cycle-associated protein 3 [Spea bombifrons]|uniref:cell division cycle-associated protein 3 n=1 Tax=Spea bombifrons TaxID=233779 RepID=UPI00234AAA47|nr:cell division cycle-associated protein 3 [Spea bombifrons]